MKNIKYLLLGLCLLLLVGWGDGDGWKEDNRVTDFTYAPVKTLVNNPDSVTAVLITPDVTSYSYFNTPDPTLTIYDFTSSNLQAGRKIIVYSSGVATYDVTSSGIKGGTTDITSMTGDILEFLYDGTDWYVVSFMDMTDNLN